MEAPLRISLPRVTEQPSNPKLWMIVPCFNEQERLKAEYWSKLLAIPNSYWVFVDDGSTDDTTQILYDFVRKNKVENVSVLLNSRNLGKGESVRVAIEGLKDKGLDNGQVVGFIDADGAFPEDEVVRFIRHGRGLLEDLQNASLEAVWSSRVALAGRQIRRNHSRHYLGRVIHTLIGTRVPKLPYDTQCGLKLFRVTESLKRELITPFTTRWFFEVELIMRYQARKSTLHIREEPLEAWTDIAGSRIRGKELTRVTLEILKLVSRKWT